MIVEIGKDFVRVVFGGESASSDGLPHEDVQYGVYEIVQKSTSTIGIRDGKDS